MQGNLLKIGFILFLVIGTTGCAETVYLSTDHGTESIKLISDVGYYIRWGLFVISCIITVLCIVFWFQLHEYDRSVPFYSSLIFGFVSIVFYIGTLNPLSLLGDSQNLSPLLDVVPRSKFTTDTELIADSQAYQQRQQLGADRYDLKVQIVKAKTNIASLKQDQDQKVLPLKQNYSRMYDQYYPHLAQQLPETGIRSHEELLKNCEQYLELCSSINRVAKLQYYISKLDDKLKQIGANINEHPRRKRTGYHFARLARVAARPRSIAPFGRYGLETPRAAGN